jgi:hypothetical protein
VTGVIVGAIAVVVVVALIVRASGRQEARIDASKARAVAGTARVVEIVGNRSSISTTAGVASGFDVTLDVTVVGRDPYRTTVPLYLWPLSIPVVQVGAELAVHVDPHDPRLVYPDNADIECDTYTIVTALKRSHVSPPAG